MHPPRIVAHRGIHHDLPENSREALWKALDDQFWVECDIHAGADGVPVVIHDDTLDRTTMRTGPVRSLTSAELQHVPLRGEGLLPTLEDCLARSAEASVGWVLEIKPPGAHDLVRRVFEMVRERLDRFVLQSFDPDNVRFMQTLKDCPHALLVGNEQELDTSLRGDWRVINVDHRLLTAGLMRQFRERGTEVGAWTVNQDADIRRVIDLGVDTIISDHPWRVREIVNELEGR